MGSFSAFLSHSFFFSLRTLVLSYLLLSLSAFYPFYSTFTFLFFSPLAHSSSSSLGCGLPIKGFVGELSPGKGCSKPDQPPPQGHSWPRGLNIVRELRPWQSGEKTEGETDTETAGRKIDLDNNPKACCTEREKREIS